MAAEFTLVQKWKTGFSEKQNLVTVRLVDANGNETAFAIPTDTAHDMAEQMLAISRRSPEKPHRLQ